VHALVRELAVLMGDPAGSGERTGREIVAALLDVPRVWPVTHPDDRVAAATCDVARTAARRLLSGAPFAYAVGRACFRHLTLDVDERVLIPRPETEQLVDEVLRVAGSCTGTAVDVGTGSGAIALALATEGKFARVIATDVSLDALAVARTNALCLGGALRARVEFRQGSLLGPLAGDRVDVIVSNPPYIAFGEAPQLPASVRDWEPPLALFAADEGMAAIAALVRGAAGVLHAGGVIALEVDSRRAALAAELLAVDARYTGVTVRLDLAGRERFVLAHRA